VRSGEIEDDRNRPYGKFAKEEVQSAYDYNARGEGE